MKTIIMIGLLVSTMAAQTATVAPPPVQLSWAPDAYNVTIAGDSLKIALSWTQPKDSLGVADSTVYIMHVSKNFKFYGIDTVTRIANTRIRRKFGTAGLADSFKLKKPAYGDSVNVIGDSIYQCRGGKCSVPGAWAFAYIRTAVPPPMTLIKIVHDSF